MAPKNAEVKEMNEEVKKIDELLKDDQEAISQVQKKSKKHKLVDEDLSDNDKIDEQSIATDSLKELNKLSDEIDKNVKKHHINQDQQSLSSAKKKSKDKEEPTAAGKKD